MAYFPPRHPKFEIEVYPIAFQYNDHSTKWYRLFMNPNILFDNNNITSSHFKIINQIPDKIQNIDYGQYYFSDGVYRLKFSCSRRWQISQTLPSSLPDVSMRSVGISSSNRGDLTILEPASGSIVDTGHTVSSGYRVVDINFSQLIEITNTTGKSYGVDFHLSGIGSYDTSDSNSEKIYKWKSTLELIEDKTVSSNQS